MQNSAKRKDNGQFFSQKQCARALEKNVQITLTVAVSREGGNELSVIAEEQSIII